MNQSLKTEISQVLLSIVRHGNTIYPKVKMKKKSTASFDLLKNFSR